MKPDSNGYSGHDFLSKAKWIWPESLHRDIYNCFALFRKKFLLQELPSESQHLYITADQSYQLYVNGIYVAKGPARGFQEHWSYDEVDILPYLVVGENVLAVRAYNPGLSNYQYINHGYAGLLVGGVIGGAEVLSDSSWKARRQSGIKRDMVPASNQLFPQENIDLREECQNWMLPNFDDSRWSANLATSPWNRMPWHHIVPRDIPMLQEKVESPKKILGAVSGVNSNDYRVTRNLALTHYAEGIEHERAEGNLPTIFFEATGHGKWCSRLIDFGKTVVGSLALDIKGALGGEIIEAHYYETLNEGTLKPDFDPNFHVALSNRLVCREGRNEHRFYWMFGFRYLVLCVRDSKTPLNIGVELHSSLYPMKLLGSFESSDSDLNKIWRSCVWTQRCCSLDAYVDTPWREQAQWWGDARVQAWNTFHICGDTRLFRRGIAQIAAQTTPEGLTYGHAPTIAHNCILPDFTLIWFITLWDYYWQTGSIEPFLAHQNTLRKALEYFHKHTNSDVGLLRYDSRYWLFLDWNNLFKEGYSSVYNLWFSYALKRLGDLYLITGDNKEGEKCLSWSKNIDLSLSRLINREGLLYDGLTYDGKMVESTSVHSQVLAILNQISRSNEENMIHKKILPEIQGETNVQSPSAYWITYVYSLLAEKGYGNEVLNDIKNRWMPMAQYGTTWENFNPKRGAESFSHAWSAHPLFHTMQILGGIYQAAPNWGKVYYRPVFYGDFAQVKYPTPHGIITSEWEKKGDCVKGNVNLPKDIKMQSSTLELSRNSKRYGGSFSFVFKYSAEEKSLASVR